MFKSHFLIALIYFVLNGLCGYGSSGVMQGIRREAWVVQWMTPLGLCSGTLGTFFTKDQTGLKNTETALGSKPVASRVGAVWVREFHCCQSQYPWSFWQSCKCICSLVPVDVRTVCFHSMLHALDPCRHLKASDCLLTLILRPHSLFPYDLGGGSLL